MEKTYSFSKKSEIAVKDLLKAKVITLVSDLVLALVFAVKLKADRYSDLGKTIDIIFIILAMAEIILVVVDWPRLLNIRDNIKKGTLTVFDTHIGGIHFPDIGARDNGQFFELSYSDIRGAEVIKEDLYYRGIQLLFTVFMRKNYCNLVIHTRYGSYSLAVDENEEACGEILSRINGNLSCYNGADKSERDIFAEKGFEQKGAADSENSEYTIAQQMKLESLEEAFKESKIQYGKHLKAQKLYYLAAILEALAAITGFAAKSKALGIGALLLMGIPIILIVTRKNTWERTLARKKLELEKYKESIKSQNK